MVITKHGRDSLVVVAAEEWARLKRGDRQAGQTAQLREEPVGAARSDKAPGECEPLDVEAAQHGASMIVAQDGAPPAATNSPIEDRIGLDSADRPSFAELLLSAPEAFDVKRDPILAQEIAP